VGGLVSAPVLKVCATALWSRQIATSVLSCNQSINQSITAP